MKKGGQNVLKGPPEAERQGSIGPWQRMSWIVLWMGLFAAPTPGAVGSCDQRDSDMDFVDLVPYCREKEQLICWRRGLRDELSESKVVDCRRKAIKDCESRFWSSDCRPTQRQAQACLNALKSTHTVQTEESDIEECSTTALCTVTTEYTTDLPSDAGEESQ